MILEVNYGSLCIGSGVYYGDLRLGSLEMGNWRVTTGFWGCAVRVLTMVFWGSVARESRDWYPEGYYGILGVYGREFTTGFCGRRVWVLLTS